MHTLEDAPFLCAVYDYSCADWNGLGDHLRDVSWEDIFKLGAFAAGTKPNPSPCFSATCAAAMTHRNHFFYSYQQNKSSASKVKFKRQAINQAWL